MSSGNVSTSTVGVSDGFERGVPFFPETDRVTFARVTSALSGFWNVTLSQNGSTIKAGQYHQH